MMNLNIQRLSDENRHLIDGFSCVETDEMLSGLNAKERRRIRKHSQDMENFLRDEAYEDQEKGLSRTYLFVNDGKLVAYLALCNDAIRLEFEERDNMELPYTTVPAVKVARLAVSVGCQGKGIGKEALQFAIYVSQMVRDYSGVVFLTLDCYEHRGEGAGRGMREKRRAAVLRVIVEWLPAFLRLWAVTIWNTLLKSRKSNVE